MMDLSGFKCINDTWGHAAGDDLLKQFGAEVQSRLRSTDLVGRWGGDEFDTSSIRPLRKRPSHWLVLANGFSASMRSATALDLFNRADSRCIGTKRQYPSRTGRKDSERATQANR